MLALRRLGRRLSWIAFLAIFGLALVPTISRALAGLGGQPSWAEVCTPLGARWVALGDPTQPVPASVGHLDHCPLCGLAGSTPPLLQASAVLAPAAAAEQAGFAPERAPLRLQRSWTAAQPRAPPALG